ncbi:MAG: CTP synthase, partial [Clostridiales bacterium]
DKLALFCDIDKEAVIQAQDCESIYDIPPMLQKQGLDNIVIKRLNLPAKDTTDDNWLEFYRKSATPLGEVKILLVGKYAELHDAYLSLTESLRHAAIHHQRKLIVKWCCSSQLTEENIAEYFQGADGVIVPGGFGERGAGGKILAAQYARENNIPFFGIGMGMQMAVIDFARQMLNLPEANSAEFQPSGGCTIIDALNDNWDDEFQEDLLPAMMLGLYPCKLIEDTLAAQAYSNEEIIYERHRHRYGINKKYQDLLEEKGLIVSGISPDKTMIHIVELKGHKWFLGCQFHPEFISRPHRPHPLFLSFMAAAIKK